MDIEKYVMENVLKPIIKHDHIGKYILEADYEKLNLTHNEKKIIDELIGKHNIALIVTLVVIAYEVFNFITSLGVGVPRNLVTMIVSVLINMVALYFISNVKKSYEEYLRNNKSDN